MTENETQFPIPKRGFTVEFGVGIFAIVGAVCFAYLAVNIAGMKLLHTGFYTVSAEFDNVSGLEVGAPVEIAGVPVGEVKNIALAGTSAVVTMAIREGEKLRSDDIASIRTKGIIGDRYVKLTPGASDNAINGGGKIADTESVVDLEDVIGKLIHRIGE